mmetsp:Transcript_134475/g.374788  ORF Transcript_134475/g.374788 Transcript_134475/m.374788 type:complete len:203 (+) Transcript_134475:221-829(+)
MRSLQTFRKSPPHLDSALESRHSMWGRAGKEPSVPGGPPGLARHARRRYLAAGQPPTAPHASFARVCRSSSAILRKYCSLRPSPRVWALTRSSRSCNPNRLHSSWMFSRVLSLGSSTRSSSPQACQKRTFTDAAAHQTMSRNSEGCWQPNFLSMALNLSGKSGGKSSSSSCTCRSGRPKAVAPGVAGLGGDGTSSTAAVPVW